MLKAMDVVRPVCPTGHLHYHIRKFFKSLENFGVVDKNGAVLLKFDEADPCKSYILVENNHKPIDK